MEIKKTNCAEEIEYVEVGCFNYELTFYKEDDNSGFDIDIEDLQDGGGATITLEKKDIEFLINFLQTDRRKLT